MIREGEDEGCCFYCVFLQAIELGLKRSERLLEGLNAFVEVLAFAPPAMRARSRGFTRTERTGLWSRTKARMTGRESTKEVRTCLVLSSTISSSSSKGGTVRKGRRSC